MNGYSSSRRTAQAVRAYQHRRRRRDSAKRRAMPPTIELIADRDFLYDCFQSIAQDGGPAPGPDGIRAKDVAPADRGRVLQHLAEMLRERTYRPGKAREVRIRKSGGPGTRTLRVANILDRVVSKALHETLTVRWEKLFLDGSFGFRRRRGPWNMLAAIEASMQSHDRFVLAVDDVRNAFDNVWLDRLLLCHRELVNDAPLLNLIRTCLRCEPLPEYRFGIAQGNCYSPTALNVLLHFEHDVPVNRELGAGRWYRFADNVVYLCRTKEEANKCLTRAGQLLGCIGMTLKGGGSGGVVDLAAGETANLLGFEVQMRGGRICYRLGSRSWRCLAAALLDALGTRNPPATANEVIRGWVAQIGPAFFSKVMVDPILKFAARLGFRELARAEIVEIGENAHKRWRKLLDRATRSIEQ